MNTAEAYAALKANPGAIYGLTKKAARKIDTTNNHLTWMSNFIASQTARMDTKAAECEFRTKAFLMCIEMEACLHGTGKTVKARKVWLQILAGYKEELIATGFYADHS